MNENMFKLFISYSLVLVLSVSTSSAGVAPSYITACPGQKPDCLKKSVQETLPQFSKGIPELGIDPIDPLRENHIAMSLPGGLTVELNNGSMTGMRKCRIDSVTYQNEEADLKMYCNFTIRGMYKASGRILVVSINGDGEAKIKIKNAFLHAKIKFEDKVRDGVVYHEVKDLKTTYDYGDKVTFALSNLFKGNAELSETVLQFLNENWKPVADEFGKPLVDKLIELIYKIVKKFFVVVPKNELFFD